MLYNDKKMKYVRMTLKYIWKNFPRLLLSIAPLTVLTVFFLHPANVFVFNPIFSPEALDGFGSIFRWLFRIDAQLWYMYPVVVVVHLLTACYLIAIIEKDFKVGRLSVRSPIHNINNTFPPVFKGYFLLVVTANVAKILWVCLLTLISFIMTSIGAGVLAVNVTLAVLTFLVFVLFILFFRALPMSVATMLLYGYGYRESYSVTIKFLNHKNNAYSVIAILFGVLVMFGAEYIMVLVSASEIVYYVVDAIIFSFFTVYICVFVMTAVYDITGVERRDLKPKWGGN